MSDSYYHDILIGDISNNPPIYVEKYIFFVLEFGNEDLFLHK